MSGGGLEGQRPLSGDRHLSESDPAHLARTAARHGRRTNRVTRRTSYTAFVTTNQYPRFTTTCTTIESVIKYNNEGALIKTKVLKVKRLTEAPKHYV